MAARASVRAAYAVGVRSQNPGVSRAFRAFVFKSSASATDWGCSRTAARPPSS
jgi:hypothetical protein